MNKLIYYLFYIVIYLTLFGGATFVALQLIQTIIKTKFILFFHFLPILFFIVPIYSTGLKLADPDVIWIDSYKSTATIWFIIMILLAGYYIIKRIHVNVRINSMEKCLDSEIIDIVKKVCNNMRISRIPDIIYFNNREVACVYGIINPKILLSKRILSKMSDDDIQLILSHELMHIKSKHLVYQGIVEIICLIHWYNPLVWFMRKRLTFACEMDCDRKILKYNETTAPRTYADLIVRLTEKVNVKDNKFTNSLGLLNYHLTKWRIKEIIQYKERKNNYWGRLIIMICIAIMICCFMEFSQSYFYPYPAFQQVIEIGGEHN